MEAIKDKYQKKNYEQVSFLNQFPEETNLLKCCWNFILVLSSVTGHQEICVRVEKCAEQDASVVEKPTWNASAEQATGDPGGSREKTKATAGKQMSGKVIAAWKSGNTHGSIFVQNLWGCRRGDRKTLLTQSKDIPINLTVSAPESPSNNLTYTHYISDFRERQHGCFFKWFNCKLFTVKIRESFCCIAIFCLCHEKII